MFSCQQKKENNDSMILLSLAESTCSAANLFSSIEIIPLETSEESLLKRVNRVEFTGENYYIYDDQQYALFIFDEKGGYKNKIQRIGHGPEEYTYVSDFVVDRDNGTIYLLSFNKLLAYDPDGNFIRSYTLPGPATVYQRMAMLDAEHFALWANRLEGEEGLFIYRLGDEEMHSCLYDFGNELLTSFNVFHVYDQDVYFSTQFDHNVYKLTVDQGLSAVYTWYLGNSYDITSHGLTSGPESYKEHEDKLNDLIETKKIHRYMQNLQNDKYLYIRLSTENAPSKTLLYNKKEKTKFLSQTTTEGIQLYFLNMYNDHAIGRVNPSDTDQLLALDITNEQSKQFIRQAKEDDNPLLIKYHFK